MTVFVSNRVEEINQLAPDAEWRHIPGASNPADLLSRGGSIHQFLDSRWWEGPEWLKEPKENWPENKLIYEAYNVESELKRVRFENFNLRESEPSWFAVRFSSSNTIARLTGWILQFINNTSHERSKQIYGNLSPEEIESAEKLLIRLIQGHFPPHFNNLKNLNAFKDGEGILSVKTRITERIDEPTFLAPILLPDKGIFNQRLIE